MTREKKKFRERVQEIQKPEEAVPPTPEPTNQGEFKNCTLPHFTQHIRCLTTCPRTRDKDQSNPWGQEGYYCSFHMGLTEDILQTKQKTQKGRVGISTHEVTQKFWPVQGGGEQQKQVSITLTPKRGNQWDFTPPALRNENNCHQGCKINLTETKRARTPTQGNNPHLQRAQIAFLRSFTLPSAPCNLAQNMRPISKWHTNRKQFYCRVLVFLPRSKGEILSKKRSCRSCVK